MKYAKKINAMVVLIFKSDKTVWDTMLDNLDNFSDDFLPIRKELKEEREDLFLEESCSIQINL